MIGNFLGYLPVEKYIIQRALAAHEEGHVEEEPEEAPEPEEDSNRDELSLIAVLVEQSLMNDTSLKNRVMKYAANAQSRIPHSKAFVLEVNKNQSTHKIASVLEKLYFEGIDTDQIDLNPLNNNKQIEDDNRLAGIVIIGDVPIPVVHEEGGVAEVSIYPYVDFYRKGYVYNHETQQFEVNSEVSVPNPEIWHGLIVPPSTGPDIAKQQLIEFFDKNESYSEDDPAFTDFEQRLLYANFPEMEQQMNFMDYRNYQRNLKFMEETAHNRFTKQLAKELVKGVSEDLGTPDNPIVTEESIDMLPVGKIFEDSFFKKYLVDFKDALKIHLGGINAAILDTGRWDSSELDTPASLIAQRDAYAKSQILRSQLELESEVNEVIEDEIDEDDRALETPTLAKLKVELTIANIKADTNTFTFYTFIDGQQVSEIESVEECGMRVGQRRAPNQSALDNNSVWVDANRMYNPDTFINPPEDDDDWELEETNSYKRYGGCVNNNSLKIEDSDLDPAKCIPEEAELSLFDIRGSIEVPEDELFAGPASRCNIGNMTFKLLNENQFNNKAAKATILAIGVNEKLKDVIDDSYVDLGGPSGATRVERASFVIKNLLASGESHTYEPFAEVEIEISVEEETKELDSIYSHVEPTNESVLAINRLELLNSPACGTPPKYKKDGFSSTPNLAADGVRSVSFSVDGLNKNYEYLNLFRLEGNNPGELTGDLLKKINNKQAELDNKTDSSTDIFQDYFVDNSNLIEPLTWKTMSIDQKMEAIIEKYTNANSFMPTPDCDLLPSGALKPEGYEILHVVANGDVHGYQFGLNRAMDAQDPNKDDDDSIFAGTGTGGLPGEGEEEDDGTGLTDEGNYLCGDPAGVEIWEWFDALQCWIEEEILPAHELFDLSNQCSTVQIPQDVEEEEENIFDELLATPDSLEVEMKRKSLVKDQEEKIKLSVFNQQGDPLLGYIDMPIHFELEDENLGEFSSNDVYIFTGERDVTFTAKKTGSSKLTVTMGDPDAEDFNEDFRKELTINVFNEINIDWGNTNNAEEIVNGRSEFTLNLSLQNEDGEPIFNINDTVAIGSEKPADGGFKGGNSVSFKNGTAEAIFLPTPGKKVVKLVSKDEYIGGEAVINPTGPEATRILLRAPPFIPIGGTEEIEVIAADPFGFPAEGFDEVIVVALDEESKDFAKILDPSINMVNGRGTLSIAGGKETGDIRMIAQHPDLSEAGLELPLLARIDSEEISDDYPQTLFASFVGFPAGDFTQEDYFGGIQLFTGKTQAVYSFLNAPRPEATLVMGANHLITPTAQSQRVLVDFGPGNQMLIEAIDQSTMETLVSKRLTLDFDEVQELGDENPDVGNLYVEPLTAEFSTVNHNDGLRLRDSDGKLLADLQTDKIRILDSNYEWVYQVQPEFNMIELTLTDGLIFPARILLNLEPETLEPENFDEISPNLKWDRIYGGSSINDPSGLYLYTHDAEVPAEDREEFYGIQGENKYISLFASGTNVGEASKYNLPTNAILLGDPTISLPTRSQSSLNFNAAAGQQIYKDPEDVHIASINHFNFNNDGFQDVAMVLKDGRIRLLEGGPTEPPYIDRGDIAALADGGVALEPFDLKGDNFEDLIVATDEGRLAILHNDNEVITRTDHQLDIGKKLYKLLKGDMDQDGHDDLVIHDSRGDIYIFYYDGENDRFPESGKWIANYGYSLKLDENISKDIDVRYDGIPEPPEPGAGVASGPKPPLEGYEGGGDIDEDAAEAHFEALYAAAAAGLEDPGNAAGGNEVPKLPWPEGDDINTYFAPIEEVNPITFHRKEVSNKDRPGSSNVDLEETLTYRIEVRSNQTLNNLVLADTVPDSLAFQTDSVRCIQGGCQGIEAMPNSVKVFFSGLNLPAGQTMIFEYDVFVANTPASDLLIRKIEEPNVNLTNPFAIIDPYLDIFVSPPYNNTGRLLYHYSTDAREYDVVQDNPPEPVENDDVNEFSEIIEAMQLLQQNGPDEDSESPIPEGIPGVDVVDACFEDPASAVTCAEGAMDNIAAAIADFSCGGAGCFPMPFNYAFMVPPQMPFPIFSFPTTLATPVGPMPFPSFFPVLLPGASNIPGPIMSQMRFYLSPTLTGGLGIAMCWGPYPVSPTVPPPVFPIPYPPPIGNCMVTATPILPKSVCSTIEDGITKAMDAISAGLSKIQNEVQGAIETVPGFQANPTGPDASAGGMEIGLAVDLGNTLKFEPPVKAFSNTHLKTFDSLGGVISSFMDRQLLEIQNKLLTLPTFSIYLPDFKSLFSLDFQKTQKQFTQWTNTLKGRASANFESAANLEGAEFGDAERNVGQSIRGGLEVVKGSKALGYVDAVQDTVLTYNVGALEGLYDVASTLPIVNLREKSIPLNIPWISAGEIQAYVQQMQNWVMHYEREYARVVDKWEQLTCSDTISDEELAENPDSQRAKGLRDSCVGRKLADAFGVNFDELIGSVKQNIEVLQAWQNFPKQLIKFKQQLADYIRSVACYLNVIAQMMGGWMATIQQQMVSWAELILTIIEIIKNIKDLFDLFTSFDSNCDICTNERFANFGWFSLLGLVLPDIPIIQFPKIPDIVFDISNMDAAIDIEIPMLQLSTVPLPLPPLPYITLPDFPTISLFLNIPPIPVLPGPPELPDLPDLPPLPTISLPTLPSPPKLPDIGKAFELIIPLIEQILNIWCIMKKSFAPVPEMSLNDQVTLLTNRPAYLMPMDLLELTLPNIALFDLGFNEVRIETVIYLGLSIQFVSEPIERAVEGWNETVNSIPEAMNNAYETYLEYTEELVQGYVDEAEAAMFEAVEFVESKWEEYVQGWIDDNWGDPIDEADQWLRDKEAYFQEWADDKLSIDVTYEQYYEWMNDTYAFIRSKVPDSEAIDKFFDENRDLIHGFNYAITFGVAGLFELADQKGLGDEIQDIMDLINEKLTESEDKGPQTLERLYFCIRNYSHCKENTELYFFEEDDEQGNAADQIPAAPQQVAYRPPVFNPEVQAQKALATPEGQRVKELVGQIADIVEEVNTAEPVDYTVLKERFNVADYKPLPKKTTVDKIYRMQEELMKYSDDLLAEAQGMKHIKDLHALAGQPPLDPLPYELASTPIDGETTERVYSNALPLAQNVIPAKDPLEEVRVELEAQRERLTAQAGDEGEEPAHTSGCIAAVCLPDEITGNAVPVIPFIDFFATSETLFMPSGHIVYSDGTGLFLKRDLTVDETEKNVDTTQPARFILNNNFMNKLGIEPQPKEAVNMLKTTFTENGAATFNWLPTSHPEVYGYGIELERTITGYDSNRQANQQADTKIILLPPTADGLPPEVIVNGEAIESGTLVTSLNDAEEASERFGVDGRNIITGAQDVRFPTVNNALINVGEYKAVYFDLLNGSSYSMNMENGFYHIKMTWFSKEARTATYNQNEILAPQIYGEESEPFDVSQTDTYYMPIYKDKTINASDIFVDLAGAYTYYWFIDPDNNLLTPEVGDSLTIAPQKEAKTIKVKLIATLDLNDDSFERYEKDFNVEVYVPGIELNQEKLNEGIIAGTLVPINEAPDDDLSDIPFSVFRKRLGTWKNVGILHHEDTETEPTSPPLNDHEGKPYVYEESYYTANSEGGYEITGFDITTPTQIELENHEGDDVAEVEPGNGMINLLDDKYELQAVPAGTGTPTHIAIIDKETQGILGNVYYIAQSSKDVERLEEGLSQGNVADSGVTVGDVNSNDDIIANTIPDEGESFPGGVAIFNATPPQVNVALVDTDGSIRMMQDGYKLELKNPSTTDGRYIFQIQTEGGSPVYDVFIQANFDNLEIDSETEMDGLGIQIGLKPQSETAFAQSTPVEEVPPVPEFRVTAPVEEEELDGSPFPDVDESHPFFKQIVDLYKARVVSGYGDGSFKPNQKLTRAEFIKIALGVTNCYDCTEPTDPQKERYNVNPFPDVSLPAWYFYCISIAKELGMITGYGDGFFRPDRNISRAEAAAVLLRQSGIELTEAPEAAFKDVPDYAWYVDYVYTAVEIGLIRETFGFVNPDEQITRGEFAFMAAGVKDLRECRLVDEDGDGVPDWWEMTHNMDPMVPDLFRACPCIDNPNQSDTDGDGRRDVCDLDIDNDGVLNPMCIFDENGNLDPNLVLAGLATLGDPLDNCIFTPNADQSDVDADGIGDICDEAGYADCPCLDNPNQNDTDGDRIPDVCDDDIDNDGVTNPICIFDDNGLLDQKIIDDAKESGIEVDNCIFDINADQVDSDFNEVGNICEEVDLCPEVPEDMDGVNDEDGCPEVDDDFPEKDPGVYVGPGDECGFIDYNNDANPLDVFLTAITDIETHEVLHSKSTELTYQ